MWHVMAVLSGKKNDLGPAEHTVAARGLSDFAVLQGIHIFIFFVTIHSPTQACLLGF